jgi:hypothetical protein
MYKYLQFAEICNSGRSSNAERCRGTCAEPVTHKVLTCVEFRAVSDVFHILTPHPPLNPASVSSPRTKGGGALAGRWGGGGSIFQYCGRRQTLDWPLSALLPLHLCSWRNTLQNIYGARILQTKMHAISPGALWGGMHSCHHPLWRRAARQETCTGKCILHSRAPDKDMLSTSGPLLRTCQARQGPC